MSDYDNPEPEPEAAPEPEPEAAPEAEAAPSGELSPDAGASGDPRVHEALAKLDIARQNRAALDVPEPAVEAADKEVADAEAALAELGYKA
jgi:hypothetical protein